VHCLWSIRKHFKPYKTESLDRQIPVVGRMPASKEDSWDTQFLVCVSSRVIFAKCSLPGSLLRKSFGYWYYE